MSPAACVPELEVMVLTGLCLLLHHPAVLLLPGEGDPGQGGDHTLVRDLGTPAPVNEPRGGFRKKRMKNYGVSII